MVDVETLAVVPVAHHLERVTARRFRRTLPDSGEIIEFDIDEYGLVHDYPNEFRRL